MGKAKLALLLFKYRKFIGPGVVLLIALGVYLIFFR